eukprot:TRINITY_DN1184_c0_g1_i1.p1 TRINITY_DN1184_c0_g1~~TRINITY_DN1184_c0_g1_i1.p1  ORF type:complete len:173 (-),score=23.83 TRINITY_DN1184_c0_g1_i1:67-585(-)
MRLGTLILLIFLSTTVLGQIVLQSPDSKHGNRNLLYGNKQQCRDLPRVSTFYPVHVFNDTEIPFSFSDMRDGGENSYLYFSLASTGTVLNSTLVPANTTNFNSRVLYPKFPTYYGNTTIVNNDTVQVDYDTEHGSYVLCLDTLPVFPYHSNAIKLGLNLSATLLSVLYVALF